MIARLLNTNHTSMKTRKGAAGPPSGKSLLPSQPFCQANQINKQKKTAFPGLPASQSTLDATYLSETELVARFHEFGEKASFAELYRRFSPLVLGCCVNYLKDPSMARDAASEVFLLLHRKLQAARPVAFRSWLFALTKNHCLQILRKEGRSPRLETIASAYELAEINERRPLWEEGRMVNSVRAAISGLPVRQMECIRMFFLQGMRYKEISEDTGWTLKEVKSHIQNGKRNLRKALGGTWLEAGFAG